MKTIHNIRLKVCLSGWKFQWIHAMDTFTSLVIVYYQHIHLLKGRLLQHVQGGSSLVNHLCYLCLVFVMLSRLFVACYERADPLALVTFSCVFVTFPCGILGHVWYLIVSIPDLCRLSGKDKDKKIQQRNYMY